MIEDENKILQNLKDAYCDSDLIAIFFRLENAGKISEQLRLLSSHRKNLLNKLHTNHKHLQTDYIDLLLIHEPYRESLSMYKAMKEAYIAGKIKAIGISNFNKEQYLNFIKHCEIIPAVNQVECHVFYRQKGLQNILEINGTHMQAWSPFACKKNNFFNNIVLKKIGKKYGKTSAQIGLRYLIQSGVSAIPKTSKIERLKENIHIFDFELDNDDIEKINLLDNGKTLFGWY